MQQKAIADWIKSSGLVKITEMKVHIHSEREMCAQCTATSTEIVANFVSHAPEIAEALQLAGGKSSGTDVSSTHKFRSAAPGADAAAAVAATPTAQPPSGKKQPANQRPGYGRV